MAITNILQQPRQGPSIVCGPSKPPLLEWTFNDILRERCLHHPNNVALICPQQKVQYTYFQLQDRSRSVAAGLSALGVQRGDRVGILLGNRAEYVEIFFACAKLGAYATLFNYAYTQTELNNALQSTDPRVLFATLRTSRFRYESMLEGACRSRPSLEHIILLDDICDPQPPQRAISFDVDSAGAYMKYAQLLNDPRAQNVDVSMLERAVRPHDVLNLQFTSGSTGLPKAAALTHRGMLNSARYIGLQMGVGEGERIAIPVPLFHAFGLIMGVCNACVYGAASVLPSEYWDVSATLSAVERFRCTGLYGVTTMFVDQLSHPAFAKTNRDSLKFGLMAGSAMPSELLHRVQSLFPIPAIYTNWGMTELSSVATMTTASDPISKKLLTAGKLLPQFVAKIVEPNTGRVLPWGQRGEIVVYGFGVMDGYYRNEEQTGKAVREHPEDEAWGVIEHQHQPQQQTRANHASTNTSMTKTRRKWMHTGDEAYLDPEGYFVITGRIKDLIIRGGENISPLEIEARLYEHPAVKQVVVFGVSSERYGEEVAAMVEVNNGFNISPPASVGLRRPDEKELQEWVGKELARFKVPVWVWWLGDEKKGVFKEWPKTANGKLRRMDVRALGEELVKKEKAATVTAAKAPGKRPGQAPRSFL